MKKQLTRAAVAMIALVYAACCLGRLEANTLAPLGTLIRCALSSTVIWGSMRGI